MIPTHLPPHYIVLRQIDAGAMSLVYEVHDQTLRTRVALKVLRPEHMLDLETLSRFVNEALPIRELRHPGLPRIFACEVPSDAPPYILMELLPESLAQRLRRGRLPLDAVLSATAQLADALQAVHEQGMVHRDVKPANVLFAPAPDDERLCLVDFGLAKRSRGGPTLPISTADGEGLGTPHYCAPEQSLDAKQAEASADIYSLGAVLYEMLSGAPPFHDEHPGRLRILHLMAPPPPLPGGEVPGSLASLCLRMLHKDPARRPNARAVTTAVRALRGG